MTAAGTAATTTRDSAKALGALARAIGAVVPGRAASLPVAALSDDSRDCRPGTLFFAVSGGRDDGARYLDQAAARGAIAAVVADGTRAEANSSGLPLLTVESVRRAKAFAAQAFHGHPARALLTAGVTGTKGKTTTACFLHAIFREAALAPSLLGTIEEQVFGRPARASTHTTPDALRLAAFMAEARSAGGRSLVMEVSSHALDQERVAGIPFRAAIFTQLAREHLDYHPTVEHYRDSKARLFAGLADDAVAAINAEDRNAFDMVARCRGRVLTYGEVPAAHVRVRAVSATVGGSRVDVELSRELGGGGMVLQVALAGRHNVLNALGAATAALGLRVEPTLVARGIAAVRSVPGRLEPVDAGQPFAVLVDYAHTDDALEKVLRLLRPLARGRLVTVFGCGGDRDRTKRPRMGRVAALHSDLVVVTSDNPRSEEPARILDEVRAGIPSHVPHVVEPDRRTAIALALADRGADDVVLIAGKGHEDYQLIGDRRLRFDDREVARELLCRRSG
jgi:UDP-N-acetylmuramyl-tripeptide synthetase